MAAVDVGDLQASLLRRMEGVQPLEDEPDFFTDPTNLIRFLKARNFDLDEAEKLLKATVEWRREKKPLSLDCKWCHDKPGIHSLRQVGHDESGRPVVYSSFIQTSTRKNTVEDSLDHVIYVIENAKRCMPPGVGGWTFVVDCSGMSLPACNPKLGYGITQVLANHYPEHLGLVICLNHNPVFHGVWKAISVFLHPNTVSKVNFARSKSKINDLFSRYFSDELATWLMDEISLNKKRPLAVTQKRFWEKPRDASASPHDPRGCPSYIREYVDARMEDVAGKGCHKPHPNILDEMSGRVAESVQEVSSGEEGGSVGSDEAAEDELCAQVDEIDIAEEYQIPTDAKSLQT